MLGLLLLPLTVGAFELEAPPLPRCAVEQRAAMSRKAELKQLRRTLRQDQDPTALARAVAEVDEFGNLGAAVLAEWLRRRSPHADVETLHRAGVHVLRCGDDDDLDAAWFVLRVEDPALVLKALRTGSDRQLRLAPEELDRLVDRLDQPDVGRGLAWVLVGGATADQPPRVPSPAEVEALATVLDARPAMPPHDAAAVDDAIASSLADAWTHHEPAPTWCFAAEAVLRTGGGDGRPRSRLARTVGLKLPSCGEALVRALLDQGHPAPLSALLDGVAERVAEQPCRPLDERLGHTLVRTDDAMLQSRALHLLEVCGALRD